MIIRAGYTISFQCSDPTPMLLMLSVHPSREGDLVTPDAITAIPNAPMESYLDTFDNRVTRVQAPAGLISFSSDFAIRDSGLPDQVPEDLPLTPVKDLPNDALVFLMPSRYVDSDSLSNLAWAEFGGVGGGARLVQTICDFVHSRLRFNYALASPFRMASDALRESVGVCRDFTHLAVALCRAMNVPARYCTGFLGDIGVPPDPAPMDFSAWFEVLLDGKWYSFDARHNVPRIGRVVMARGRDAADVAISTAFGNAQLTRFEVTTYEDAMAKV